MGTTVFEARGAVSASVTWTFFATTLLLVFPAFPEVLESRDQQRLYTLNPQPISTINPVIPAAPCKVSSWGQPGPSFQAPVQPFSPSKILAPPLEVPGLGLRMLGLLRAFWAHLLCRGLSGTFQWLQELLARIRHQVLYLAHRPADGSLGRGILLGPSGRFDRAAGRESEALSRASYVSQIPPRLKLTSSHLRGWCSQSFPRPAVLVQRLRCVRCSGSCFRGLLLVHFSICTCHP